MRAVRDQVVRLLIGTLLGVLINGSYVGIPSIVIPELQPTLAYADTCTTPPNATPSGTTGVDNAYSGHTLQGVQATIEFNSYHLGTGDLCGGTDFYWMGYLGASSGGTNCSGGEGFVQDGWVAHNDATPQYQFFSEYYDGTGNAGCGNHTVYDPSISLGSSGTFNAFRVNQVSGTFITKCGSGNNSDLQFWFNGSMVRDACVYWDFGNYIEEETERTGGTAPNYAKQTHIGAVEYDSSKYCENATGGGCTPNTTHAWSTTYSETQGTSYVNAIGNHNFHTCDNRDFSVMPGPNYC